MILTVICDICEHKLATVEEAELRVPLTGDLFGPPEAGYPAPFAAEATWLDLRCPMCGWRAFSHPTQIRTAERGLIAVPGAIDTVLAELAALEGQLATEAPPNAEQQPQAPEPGDPAAPAAPVAGSNRRRAQAQALLDAAILQRHRDGQPPGVIAAACGISPQKVVARLRALRR